MAIDQFSRSLPMMLFRTLDAVMPRFRKIFNDFGLTEPQGRVLRVLWEQDAIAFGELGRLTQLPAPSLVGIIDRLSAMGLVERQRSAADRRVVNIVATAEGRGLQADIMPKIAAEYAALKQAVDARVWQQVLEGLHSIAAAAAATRQDS